MKRTWQFATSEGRFTLSLAPVAFEDGGSRLRLQYEFYWHRWSTQEPLFAGSDFTTPAMHNPFSDEGATDPEAPCALLSFFLLRPGDTDSEYFEGYNSIQREWVETFSDSLEGELAAHFGREFLSGR